MTHFADDDLCPKCGCLLRQSDGGLCPLCDFSGVTFEFIDAAESWAIYDENVARGVTGVQLKMLEPSTPRPDSGPWFHLLCPSCGCHMTVADDNVCPRCGELAP